MNQRRRPRPPRLYLGLLAVFVLLALPNWVSNVVIALAVASMLYKLYKLIKRRRPQPTPVQDGIPIGTDANGNSVVLTDRQLAAHGLILGAAGSGKTTTLLTVLTGQIARGRPVVAIDLKGSPTVINGLRQAAAAAGRPFRLWTPDGPGHWNPLAQGNPTELKDKLICTEQWSEPHYQRAAERYLQTAIQIIHTTAPDTPATLSRVVTLLEPKRLAATLGNTPKDTALRVREYLSTLTPDQRSGIAGLASRLAVITESHTGQYLEPDHGSEIDLRRALANHEVVLFSLNASTYGKLAAHLAALIIQDLTVTAGHRLNQPNRELALVAIDEFSALDTDNILALIARAREAGISVLLTTQELADLDRLTGLRDQILGNVVLTIAHRQNVPSSAELIAKLVGTNPTWQHTYQTETGGLLATILGAGAHAELETGLGSKRQVEEFRIHPNTIKELQTGQAILIAKVPRATAKLISVTATRPYPGNAH